MDTKRIKEVAERLSNSVVGENSQVRVALITSALVTLINEQKEAKNISSNLVVIGSLLCPTCNKRMDDKEMSVCSDAVHKWYEQISA